MNNEELIDMVDKGECVSDVDVSNITDMTCMFEKDKSFNQDISNWKIHKDCNTKDMFGPGRNWEWYLKYKDLIVKYGVGTVLFIIRSKLEGKFLYGLSCIKVDETKLIGTYTRTGEKHPVDEVILNGVYTITEGVGGRMIIESPALTLVFNLE